MLPMSAALPGPHTHGQSRWPCWGGRAGTAAQHRRALLPSAHGGGASALLHASSGAWQAARRQEARVQRRPEVLSRRLGGTWSVRELQALVLQQVRAPRLPAGLRCCTRASPPCWGRGRRTSFACGFGTQPHTVRLVHLQIRHVKG